MVEASTCRMLMLFTAQTTMVVETHFVLAHTVLPTLAVGVGLTVTKFAPISVTLVRPEVAPLKTGENETTGALKVNLVLSLDVPVLSLILKTCEPHDPVSAPEKSQRMVVSDVQDVVLHIVPEVLVMKADAERSVVPKSSPEIVTYPPSEEGELTVRKLLIVGAA